jgi:hypothetical protein
MLAKEEREALVAIALGEAMGEIVAAELAIERLRNAARSDQEESK